MRHFFLPMVNCRVSNTTFDFHHWLHWVRFRCKKKHNYCNVLILYVLSILHFTINVLFCALLGFLFYHNPRYLTFWLQPFSCPLQLSVPFLFSDVLLILLLQGVFVFLSAKQKNNVKSLGDW